DTLPLMGQGDTAGKFSQLVAQAAGEAEEDILGGDLFLYLREEGRVWGAGRQFISSPKLDDLQCAWSCVRGLIDCGSTQHTVP
ncbi:hypothetical protein RSW15_24845, partial [Escherichia coli]